MNQDQETYYTGSCRFCGQVGAMNSRRFATQEEADEYATEHCACNTAVEERRINDQIEKAEQRVREVFGDGAEALGFQPVADQEIFRVFDALIELTARGQLYSTTLQIRGRCKATIGYTSKNEIKIGRSETRAFQCVE